MRDPPVGRSQSSCAIAGVIERYGGMDNTIYSPESSTTPGTSSTIAAPTTAPAMGATTATGTPTPRVTAATTGSAATPPRATGATTAAPAITTTESNPQTRQRACPGNHFPGTPVPFAPALCLEAGNPVGAYP